MNARHNLIFSVPVTTGTVQELVNGINRELVHLNTHVKVGYTVCQIQLPEDSQTAEVLLYKFPVPGWATRRPNWRRVKAISPGDRQPPIYPVPEPFEPVTPPAAAPPTLDVQRAALTSRIAKAIAAHTSQRMKEGLAEAIADGILGAKPPGTQRGDHDEQG